MQVVLGGADVAHCAYSYMCPHTKSEKMQVAQEASVVAVCRTANTIEY